ncbi:hypothetical protein ACGE24_03175 [Corynebacterium kroppenstedtii]|uniref:Rv0361 family membrane protein n=1 Tax=Corynebacterium sp. PCR 32 TaxID=3351342 RepID=UPI0030A7E709
MPDVVMSDVDGVHATVHRDGKLHSRHVQVRRWGAVVIAVSVCGALGACSHGSSDGKKSSTATQSSSSASSSNNPSASSSAAASPSAEHADRGGDNHADNGKKLGADIPTVPDSKEVPSSGPKPVKGKTGSADDVASIKDALGHYGDTSGTVRQYYESTKAYTCKDRIAAHPEVFSDENINSLPNELIDKMNLAGSIPKFNNISNIKVDGHRATASVNTTFNGATSTGTMLFTKEDGQWKICSD